MTDVVQDGVVDRLPDVFGRTFGIGGGDDLVLSIAGLVGGEDADFPPGDLLLVDVHRLGDVIDLTLHFPQLRRLQIQHLQEVVRQRVDLVRHRRQTLGRVPRKKAEKSALKTRRRKS